jgi:hypothetical protein
VVEKNRRLLSVKSISIKHPDQIPLIEDVIHDAWFDVSNIEFDSNTSVLTIEFERELKDESTVVEKNWMMKKMKVPLVQCFLNFSNVESYKIDDTERVGYYDFTTLEYNSDLRCISIITGTTIDIEIKVRDFEVSVVETTKSKGVKIVKLIFGLIESE